MKRIHYRVYLCPREDDQSQRIRPLGKWGQLRRRCSYNNNKEKWQYTFFFTYRMFRKNCVFFTIHCNPSLASIAVRDLQSSQRNARVQSYSYWLVIFCTTICSRVLESWHTFENSWKKHNIK